MDASEILYKALAEDFGMEGATGSVRFNLRDFGITVEQNNITLIPQHYYQLNFLST